MIRTGELWGFSWVYVVSEEKNKRGFFVVSAKEAEVTEDVVKEFKERGYFGPNGLEGKL